MHIRFHFEQLGKGASFDHGRTSNLDQQELDNFARESSVENAYLRSILRGSSYWGRIYI